MGAQSEIAVPPSTQARLAARSRSLAGRIAAAALSLLAAILLTEAVLRLVSTHLAPLLDVEMWRYARLVKRPSELPGLVEEHRPGVEARLMGVAMRTDERGFRRPDPAAEAARRPGDRRAVAIGDSVTLGWGVPEAETWPARLERRLRESCPGSPVRFDNAGVGNSNVALQLARYEYLVRPLDPDWVVVGWFVNDAEPDPRPAEHPLVWRSALAALADARLSQWRDGVLRDYRAYYLGLYEDGRSGWERARAALAAFGRRLADDGVAATLLLLPEMHEPAGFGPFVEAYAAVAAVGRASGFEVIDGSAGFPPGPGDRWFVTPTDAHPDADAQARFAEALLASRFACP